MKIAVDSGRTIYHLEDGDTWLTGGRRCDICQADSVVQRCTVIVDPRSERHWSVSDGYGTPKDGSSYVYDYCLKHMKGVAPDELLALFVLQSL